MVKTLRMTVALVLLLIAVSATACAGPVCACTIPEPPADISEAATNAEWAKTRLALLRGKPLTTGILVSKSENTGQEISSGQDAELYPNARKMFVERGLIKDGAHGYSWHVEGKTAYLLNHYGVQYAVLVINNPEGPCTTVSGTGCSGLTARAIPEGATLIVWWGDPNADPMTVQSRPFHNPVDDDKDGKKKGRR